MQSQLSGESIHKILEYWYMIEFLGQDNFPARHKYIEKVKKHKRNLKEGKPSETKQLVTYADVTNTEIVETVRDEVKECNMNCWGNITVYIGKIKREDCIKNLISSLGLQSDKRPEISADCIALASFQVTPNGDYIDDSLSLSPVLWAVKQFQDTNNNISAKLNHSLYYQEILDLEKILVPKEDDEELYNILLKDIDRLYSVIYDKFLKGVFNEELNVEKTFVIIYQMFFDEVTKENNEVDTYTGLSKDYYTRDIRMLIDKNAKGKLNNTMQDYILSLHKRYINKMDVDRIDVIHCDNPKEYELFLNRILRLKNAPLGK